MNKRQFLAGLLGGTLLAATSAVFAGLPYEPGLINKQLAEGKTVFVDYYASWCGTCAAQKRVIAQLRTENPQYDEKIHFVKVDWDQYANHEVTTSRNIPRRSTLILLRGNKELGRIVAGTSKSQIKALLDKAL